jgi:hypothetical protein
MAQIPFPPGGPQVQAALQNPARFPDQRLQQYAQGQQPTGQVPPPMAANELTIRNAQRQAASRQSAMQNNPQNSPTVFQQKDMELQQKAQQLAAMQQQMQQKMQQKEQQLGIAGALMAKKAQDLQAREQGIAALSLPQNMFTAMDGGIVFNGGGNVEGYASRGLVGRYTPIKTPLEEMGFGQKGDTTLATEDPLDISIDTIRQRIAGLKNAATDARFSPEEREKRLKEAEEKYAGQYEKYKQGIGGLDEETVKALIGEAPTFQERVGRGLARLPADLRGVRLGGALAAIAGGAAEVDASYEARKREAAKYLAAARRKQAEADFAEQRSQPELAKKLVDSAEADKLKAFALDKSLVEAEIGAEKGIATLQQKEDLSQTKLEAARAAREQKEAFERDKLRLTLELQYEKLKAVAEKGKSDGKTDLQFLSRTAYESLKEANDKLPPGERKSEAQLRTEASKLASNTIYSARNESARANALRAAASNAKNVAEALSKLKFDPIYIEADSETKSRMEREIRDMFPSTGGGVGASGGSRSISPSGGSTPPPPAGFIPNSR